MLDFSYKSAILCWNCIVKPYQEWWRERPDETRQPVRKDVGAKSGGKREMRIRYTHIESVDVRFFVFWAQLEKIFLNGIADLFAQFCITEASKYTKYSFGFRYLICTKISRFPFDKSFSELALSVKTYGIVS